MVLAGLTSPQILAAILVVAAGVTVQAAVGFGSGLVAAPLLALIDPRLVPVPLMIAGLLVSIAVTARERRSVDLFGLKWALLGRLAGVIAAVLVASRLPADGAAILFGCLVLLAVGLSAAGFSVKATRPALVGAGTLSGFMGTLTSIGAPPVAMLYQRASGARLRATMSGYLLVGVTISLVALALAGEMGLTEVTLFLVLIPGVVVGLLVSARAKHVLDQGYTRPAVLAVSAASSIVVILRQIL